MEERLRDLKEIPFKAILTTNFDTLIPGSTSYFLPSAVKIRSEILRSTNANFREQFHVCNSQSEHTPVLQLHGSTDDPDSMVCTRKGYRSLLHGNESYLNFIRAIMTRYTLLYIGFSFSDYYLNDMRSSVLTMLQSDMSSKPLAYAITSSKTIEEQEFFLRHEGTHFMNFMPIGGDYSGFDRIFKKIREETSPLVIFGKCIAGKRILFNDDITGHAFQEKPWGLYTLLRKCSRMVGCECDIIQCRSAEETMEYLRNASFPVDLVVTQYGASTGEWGQALKILIRLKQMQLHDLGSEVDDIQNPSTIMTCAQDFHDLDANPAKRHKICNSTKFSSYPPVIVYGMSNEAENRSKQVKALGALAYVAWSEWWLSTSKQADQEADVMKTIENIHRAFQI